MFLLVVIGWIIFRSQTISELSFFLAHLSFRASNETTEQWLRLLLLILPLCAVQGMQGWFKNLLFVTEFHWSSRALIYSALFIAVCLFTTQDSPNFIYFQF